MLEYMSNLISNHRAKRQFSKRYNKIVSDYNTKVCASITYSRTLHCLRLYDYSLSRSDADRQGEVVIVGKDPFASNYMSNFVEYITGEQLDSMARYAIRHYEMLKKLDKEAHIEKKDDKEAHIERKEEAFHRVLRDGDGKEIEHEAWTKLTTTEKTTE